MSDQQRLMKKGKLGELREELKVIEKRAWNELESLQTSMFVYESPLNLDAERIVVGAKDLQGHINDAAKIREQITRLEEELGE